MAEKRTINIDINNNADEAAKDFENFAKATNVANDSVEGLNKTFEEVYGELQPLTTRMGEAEDRLYELSLAGDTASKEYQELLKSVGNYRKVQIQTDLAVDQAAGTFSQKLGGALTGATSGFAAVQGTMALVGTESEALEETLLKVQGALALQQGVQGVLEYSKSIGLAGKATKVFNLIVKANPLALLATAIIGIIGYFAVFTDAIDVAIDGLKGVGDFLGITNFKEEELAEERRKRNIAQMERQKAEQILRDAEIKQLEALGKSTIELRRQQIQADISALKSSQDLYDTQFKLLAKIQGKEFERSGAAIEKQAQIIALETQLIELDKEKTEKAKQYATDRINATRQIQNAQVELLEEGSKKEIVENKLKFDRLREDTLKATNLTRKEKQKLIDLYDKQEMDSHKKIVDNFIAELERQQTETQNRIDAFNNAFQDEIEALAEENYQNTLTEQERELLAVQDKYFRLETLAEGNAEALLEIEIARANEENDINLKYDKAAYDAKKALDDKAAEDEKKRIEQNFEFAKQGADALQQLSDLVFSNKMSKLEKGSKAEEKLARKQFKFNKALQLSGAVIDAAKAINSSLAQSPIAIGPVPNPAGIASLAFAATTSAMNIAKIASSKFESTSTGVDTPTPDVGGGGAPQFNVVGDSGVNQLAQLQQQPTQAYVVSGEVTTAQALDRNRVQNATL